MDSRSIFFATHIYTRVNSRPKWRGLQLTALSRVEVMSGAMRFAWMEPAGNQLKHSANIYREGAKSNLDIYTGGGVRQLSAQINK